VKKLLFSLPLLFASSTAVAQATPASAAPAFEPLDSSNPAMAAPATLTPVPSTADEPVTLTKSGGFLKHNGWYVAPTFGATTLDGHLSSLVGVRGGWLINRQFGIGLTGNAIGWDDTIIDVPRPNTRVEGGYGGVLLQYVIASDKLLHGTVDATFGGGALCLDPTSGRRDCNDAITFYVFEPTVNLELNVTSFMRVAVGGGYRFAAVDRDSSAYKPEVGGFVTRTTVAFGQF
jgi:hypothetical protein